MKTILIYCMLWFVLPISSQELVATFKGIQVTGLAIAPNGRMFANFPRWRENVPFVVVEVFKDGSYTPYPNEAWNSWKNSSNTETNQFVAIQSVLAVNNELYVLETNNPQFQGVISAPKVYVFDLEKNQLKKIYTLSEGSFYKNSYINDLRVDQKRQWIYFTDSGVGGIVVLDMKAGTSKRYLDQHKVTLAETSQLQCSNGVWKNTVHSDGIEWDPKKDILYFHALTGYTLYGIKIPALLKNDVKGIFSMTTAAPDGLVMDKKGNIYFGDLEHDAIQYLTKNKTIKTLSAASGAVKWADSFAIYNKYLYYTNSRINEATGTISALEFSIYKIPLPQ